MAQLTLTIPDALLPRLTAAYSQRWSLEAIDGEDRDTFARRAIGNQIRDHIAGHEADQAALASITDSDLPDQDIKVEDPEHPDPDPDPEPEPEPTEPEVNEPQG